MKKTTTTAVMAAAIACAMLASATAHAQTRPLQAQPPRELDPAKRVPVTPQATRDTDATVPAMQAMQDDVPATSRPQSYAAGDATAAYEDGRGGFFIGVQGGKGWVYDDVDQSALMVNAGYRWQAGPVALVGIEVASGRLGDTENDGIPVGDIDYASIGVNARFNFGRGNPVYGLVRAGYWAAEEDDSGMDVDGGYFGLGLGADINRHVNVSLVYTNHVYFDDYYWGSEDYTINSADTLMLGAEVRF